MYTRDSTHDGWPVLKNAKGKYCYRYAPDYQWYLDQDLTPNEPAVSRSTGPAQAELTEILFCSCAD